MRLGARGSARVRVDARRLCVCKWVCAHVDASGCARALQVRAGLRVAVCAWVLVGEGSACASRSDARGHTCVGIDSVWMNVSVCTALPVRGHACAGVHRFRERMCKRVAVCAEPYAQVCTCIGVQRLCACIPARSSVHGSMRVSVCAGSACASRSHACVLLCTGTACTSVCRALRAGVHGRVGVRGLCVHSGTDRMCANIPPCVRSSACVGGCVCACVHVCVCALVCVCARVCASLLSSAGWSKPGAAFTHGSCG